MALISVRSWRLFCTATCPLGTLFLSIVWRWVVHISEVENAWQTQSGACCVSVIWRQSMSQRICYWRFHCISLLLQLTCTYMYYKVALVCKWEIYANPSEQASSNVLVLHAL